MSEESKILNIGFYAEAYMMQSVEIVSDVTKEELINGLNEGKYFTTIDIGDDESSEILEFDNNGNEVTIAIIHSQSVEGDSHTHSFTELHPTKEYINV